MVCHREAFDLPTGCPEIDIDLSFPDIDLCSAPSFEEIDTPTICMADAAPDINANAPGACVGINIDPVFTMKTLPDEDYKPPTQFCATKYMRPEGNICAHRRIASYPILWNGKHISAFFRIRYSQCSFVGATAQIFLPRAAACISIPLTYEYTKVRPETGNNITFTVEGCVLSKVKFNAPVVFDTIPDIHYDELFDFNMGAPFDWGPARSNRIRSLELGCVDMAVKGRMVMNGYDDEENRRAQLGHINELALGYNVYHRLITVGLKINNPELVRYQYAIIEQHVSGVIGVYVAAGHQYHLNGKRGRTGPTGLKPQCSKPPLRRIKRSVRCGSCKHQRYYNFTAATIHELKLNRFDRDYPVALTVVGWDLKLHVKRCHNGGDYFYNGEFAAAEGTCQDVYMVVATGEKLRFQET